MKENTLNACADIPNQAGFALLLVRANGVKQWAKVVKGEDSCHYCATPSGKRINLTGEPEYPGLDPRSPVIGWQKYVAPIGPDVHGMVCQASFGLYTREQTCRALSIWGCTENPPVKGKAVFVNFPPGTDFPLVVINVWPNKNTEGKMLFAHWHYKKAI